VSAKTERLLHGSPTYRSTIKCLVAGTAKDSTNTTGTQYTWGGAGGEMLELHNWGPSAAYIEVIASGSYTAAGVKSFTLEVGEKYSLKLAAGNTTVTADGISGACDVDVHEKEID